ncbi:hypothetical protein SCFA_3070006 [anaerobic digester metagenome]|jgi:hypothetical protein|uniref:Uncharacterized protein n=1 Tax=anaerobic digester metagenome TaxID=1263854 RepID=A0A485M0Y6_9ZZZZ
MYERAYVFYNGYFSIPGITEVWNGYTVKAMQDIYCRIMLKYLANLQVWCILVLFAST